MFTFRIDCDYRLVFVDWCLLSYGDLHGRTFLYIPYFSEYNGILIHAKLPIVDIDFKAKGRTRSCRTCPCRTIRNSEQPPQSRPPSLQDSTLRRRRQRRLVAAAISRERAGTWSERGTDQSRKKRSCCRPHGP
jgi:hypothetical protein